MRAVAIGEGGSAISGPAVENGRVKIPIMTPLCGDPPCGCAEVVARKTPEICTFAGATAAAAGGAAAAAGRLAAAGGQDGGGGNERCERPDVHGS